MVRFSHSVYLLPDERRAKIVVAKVPAGAGSTSSGRPIASTSNIITILVVTASIKIKKKTPEKRTLKT